MATPTITVTVRGPQGSGKSLIAEIIQDALTAAAIKVRHDPENGVLHPRSLESLWTDAAEIPVSPIVQLIETNEAT